MSPTGSAGPRWGRSGEWFDVDAFRSAKGRVAVLRRATQTAVVLGSTQDERVVDRRRMAQSGFALARRRSGGGAVLVTPGDPLWIDLWIPRGDPLWSDDVSVAAEWVGEWWVAALSAVGLGGDAQLSVQRGSSVRSSWSDLVCFAGAGPGEVFIADRSGSAAPRKLVGVAQWRGREGALFHSAAYCRFEPQPLVELLDVPDDGRLPMIERLSSVATGLEAVAGGDFDVDRLRQALIELLPSGAPWAVQTEP